MMAIQLPSYDLEVANYLATTIHWHTLIATNRKFWSFAEFPCEAHCSPQTESGSTLPSIPSVTNGATPSVSYKSQVT